jgi:hypothetical protein
MTAEVAIVTRTAIAVAADSAVTVGGKVHRSTTKIFAISEDIGAMIHGNSELGGLSWEVLLKLFRKEHGRDSFATVEDCYKALRAFLNEPRFRLESDSLESLIRFSIEIIEYVRRRVSILDQGERTLERVRTIIDDEIKIIRN